ncbi:SRPBCC family protein [Streptomyces sp. NPDC054765]
MDRYDLLDEALLEAGPDRVWDALISEFGGAAQWWVPDNTFEPGRGTAAEVGGTTLVTVHTKGVDKGGPKIRFTARTTAVEPGRRLVLAYVHGAFRGSAEFTVGPLEDGGTRLALRFRARPHGGFALLARLVDVGAQHSRATRAAFARLNARLSTSPRPAVGGRAVETAVGGERLPEDSR